MASALSLEDPFTKIRNDNPYFVDYSDSSYMGGKPVSIAKTWADYQKGREWQYGQDAWQNMLKSMGSTSGTATPWGIPGRVAQPAAPEPGSDISVIKKPIDTELSSAVTTILGRVPELKDNLKLLSAEKNPLATSLVQGAAERTAGAGGTIEQSNQRLDDFVNQYMGDVGKTGEYTQSDVDQITRTMGGELGGKLKAARTGIETGLQDEYSRGLGQIGRGLSFSSMAGRGGSSGSDAIAATKFSELLSKLRLARAEAQRADVLAEEAAKQSLIGRREALLTEQARLGLLPLDLYNQQSNQDLSQIGNLANLIYGTQYQRPEMTQGELEAMRLQLLGLGQRQLYGNTPLNITGLSKEFPNVITPGVPRVSARIPNAAPQVSYFDPSVAEGYNPYVQTAGTSTTPMTVPDYRLSPEAYSYYQSQFENPEIYGGGEIPPYSRETSTPYVNSYLG